jgi:hypothetical protein
MDRPMGGLALILRLEWVALFLAGVYRYLEMHGNPYWLLPALLAPDLSMVGYLAGPRVGAVTYNLAHNLVVPIVLLGLGWPLSQPVLSLAGAVLFAHVAVDRALGYGLKLPSGFRDTHLGRIGRG